MTEVEWLSCTDPREMWDIVAKCPRASDRTFRLYVAAFWGWQAHRLRPEQQADLQKRVASMDHWAEMGKLPKGVRKSRSENVIFFGRSAQQAARITIYAPGGWGSEAPAAFAIQPLLLRDIFGNPFQKFVFSPDWRTDTVLTLALQMYESRDFSAMPILADALQDAGCDNDEVLNHCRATNALHVRGCWVVDLVLGKH